MLKIAVENQKGGSGKTTVTVHLATAFAAGGYRVILIDLDPQTSSAEWRDARKAESPHVIAVPPSRLNKVLEESEAIGADIVLMDTAPHSEGAALNAARAADLILIPCQPSIMDLRALRKTAELLSHVKKPAYVILNCVASQGTVSAQAARTITEEFGLPVADVSMAIRVAYSRCLIEGLTAQEYEPVSKAAREVQKLYKWVCRLFSLPIKKEVP